MHHSICAILSFALFAAPGCRTAEKLIAPSNNRDWDADQAVLPYADFHGNQVMVHNIRNCKYVDKDVFIVDYYDKAVDVTSIQGVDFLMVPFDTMPTLAHTMLSFEMVGPDGRPDYLAVSVEVRKEKGEVYNPVKGSARQYELMYVLADERDVIQLRTNYRGEQVFLYDTTATRESAQRLFVDVMGRVNELASRPEFYDTVTNNCTTNIVRHINRIQPNRVPYDLRLLLPGYSDQVAFEQGLIVPHGSFEQTKAQALINPFAHRFASREDFSEAIRRR